MANRMAGANPAVQTLIHAASPGLAALLLTQAVGAGDLGYGSDENLPGELGLNLLGMELPILGAATGALAASAVSPVERAALRAMVNGEQAYKRYPDYVNPESELFKRLNQGLAEREAELIRNGVAVTGIQEALQRGSMRRIGGAASIGAIAASIPAVAAMMGDWPQSRGERQ